MTLKEANKYLDLLLKNILWKSDEAVICSKNIVTKRKDRWFGDTDYYYQG